MATDTLIEQRLNAVEKAVQELQHRFADGKAAPNWLEKITGSFKDEPAFEDVLLLGRAFRAADPPAEQTRDNE